MTQDPRIDRLEGIVEQVVDRLNSLESTTNARFNSLEARLDARFQSLETRMLQLFLAVLGVQITGFIALGVAIVLKG